ncbi:hypothetical protein DBR39_13745 [Chryseobacterium sp. KBW03]|uniref:hypothetical protein n=1 Tax=Chryseobacterium sp. KBW03 TaxID=2153362 RepID=UPI000F5A94C2|nr:hypothetical protein [Chryseobacterium sp. KBW03]RQO37945.1 hypothetical protein DBR39_13745 [Chryseobacterium sp. KBW03]
MNKFIEKAQDYFERHPSSDECHVTSDGRVFHTIGSAQSMSGTLDDQKIESYKRKVLEKELLGKSLNDENLTTGGDQPTPAEILAMEVFLQNNEVDKLKYEDLKSLVKFFNLQVENAKAPTLIAALTEFKTTLNK